MDGQAAIWTAAQGHGIEFQIYWNHKGPLQTLVPGVGDKEVGGYKLYKMRNKERMGQLSTKMYPVFCKNQADTLNPEDVIKVSKEWTALSDERKDKALNWARGQLENDKFRCRTVMMPGAAQPEFRPYASTGLVAALKSAFPKHFPTVTVLQLAWVSVRVCSRLKNPGMQDLNRDEDRLLEEEMALIENNRDKIVGIQLHPAVVP